jgi:hypothetical protein
MVAVWFCVSEQYCLRHLGNNFCWKASFGNIKFGKYWYFPLHRFSGGIFDIINGSKIAYAPYKHAHQVSGISLLSVHFQKDIKRDKNHVLITLLFKAKFGNIWSTTVTLFSPRDVGEHLFMSSTKHNFWILMVYLAAKVIWGVQLLLVMPSKWINLQLFKE